MARMRQSLMLAAGVATLAVLAGCSGRSWMVADTPSPASHQTVSEAANSASAMKALASGRFAEAAALHAALLEESPDNRQAQLGYALAQLGLGQADQAVLRLQALTAASGSAPDPDVGLALALAGQPQEGIALLEEAARQPGAGPRTRQNLALALALADAWPRARTLLEREVGQSQATRQLTQWAVWAALPPQDRLAGFLGVVPARSATTLAHAEPPLFMAAKPAEPQPEVMIAQAAAENPDDAPEAVAAPETEAAPVVQSAQQEAVKPSATGWVVQLAAVRRAENLEAGWHSLQSRHPSLLSRYTPQLTQGQGWNRLSIGAFSGRTEAMAECQTLRRRGIDCFARKADA